MWNTSYYYLSTLLFRVGGALGMRLPACPCTIMEYGSTPYVGMALEKNGLPIQCVQNDMLRTLL